MADESGNRWTGVADVLRRHGRRPKPGGLRKLAPADIRRIARWFDFEEDPHEVHQALLHIARLRCESFAELPIDDPEERWKPIGAQALLEYWFPPAGASGPSPETLRIALGKQHGLSRSMIRKYEDWVIASVAQLLAYWVVKPTDIQRIPPGVEASVLTELVFLLERLYESLTLYPQYQYPPRGPRALNDRARISNNLLMVYQPLLLSGALVAMRRKMVEVALQGQQPPLALLQAVRDSVVLSEPEDLELALKSISVSASDVGKLSPKSRYCRKASLQLRKQLSNDPMGYCLVMGYVEAVIYCLMSCTQRTYRSNCLIHTAMRNAATISRLIWLYRSSVLDLPTVTAACAGLQSVSGLRRLETITSAIRLPYRLTLRHNSTILQEHE